MIPGNQIGFKNSIGSFELVWAALGGLGLGLSFPPIGWFLFAWISFVPLFRICIRFSTRDTFLLSWVFHIAMVSVAFYWPVLHHRLDTALISLVAMIALSMLLAVPFAIAAAVARLMARGISPTFAPIASAPGTIVLAGLLVSVLDLILLRGPVPMPWLSPGNTQAMSSLVVSLAPSIGSFGIGVLIVLVNMMIAIGMERRDLLMKNRIGVALAIPILILVAVFFPRKQATSTEQSVRLGILQPGIRAQDWAKIQDLSRVDSLLAFSEFALSNDVRRPEMVIWPETALPYASDLKKDEMVRQKLAAWVKRNHVAILTGAITESTRLKQDDRAAGGTWFRNTVSYFDTTGVVTHRGKNILVPFAEYVPFSLSFPALTSLSIPAGGVSGYLPEDVPSFFINENRSFGVMICFESAFPHYAQLLANAGSQFLVVITQDGWWNSNAPRLQHFYYSRYRAAETGLAVVQVSVDGISGVIRPDGSVQILTRPATRNQLVVDVPLPNSPSFYMRFGDLMLILVLSVWITALVYMLIRSNAISGKRRSHN